MILSKEQLTYLEKISESGAPESMKPIDVEIFCHLEKLGYISLNPSFSDGRYHPLYEANLTQFGRAELEYYKETQKEISEEKAYRLKKDKFSKKASIVSIVLSGITLLLSLATLISSWIIR